MGVGVLPFFLFWIYMANYLFNMFYKYCKVPTSFGFGVKRVAQA
jgi:hypothetical protein